MLHGTCVSTRPPPDSAGGREPSIIVLDQVKDYHLVRAVKKVYSGKNTFRDACPLKKGFLEQLGTFNDTGYKNGLMVLVVLELE